MMLQSILRFWGQRKIVWLSYLFTLIMGLFAAIPLYKILHSFSSHSGAFQSLAEGFDFMVLTDMLRLYGEDFVVLIPKLIFIFGAYGFLYSFFSGGLIDSIVFGELKFRRFMVQSLRYWLKTIGLSLLLTGLFMSFSAISFLIYKGIQKAISVPNYRSLALSFVPSVLLMSFAFISLFLIWDYCRIMIRLKPKNRLFKSFAKAVRTIFTHLYPLNALFKIVLVNVLITLIYLWFEKSIVTRTTFLIIILLIIQQIFVWFRLYFRLLHIRLAADFTASHKE